MSRVARKPITIPANTEIQVTAANVVVKGKKGQLDLVCHDLVSVNVNDNAVTVEPKGATKDARMFAGTIRALLNNIIVGVTDGFEKKLVLVGVGYRAQVQGKALNLTLGLSHPVSYPIPEGITVETPSQTEILIRGIDKQKVGQVAAEIREFRRPEPYKGKGIRYANEVIILKETKKK